ncbi:MAG: 23S rRNA (guanosine(2251)-2'-O)-methyltransferase RlmB [Bacteroidota bacterium]|jgi:23S rRNA (guanosine2251-2'-O)-methyltransferase
MYNKDNRRKPNRENGPQRRTEEGRSPKKTPEDLIYGVRSVIEAINAGREINRVLIQKGMNKDLFFELKESLAGKDYPLQFVPPQKLDKLTDANHQGVVAFVSPIEYSQIEPLIDAMLEQGKKPLILVLDRITDVRNFGGIARTAECEGVDAILIPARGSALVTADAIKTSAGALNRIPVCKTNDLKNSLFYLQQSGLRIVACTEKSSVPLYEVNLRGSVAVIMGSEESGISSDLLNMADIKVRIPMKGDIASLNVGVATGMILYERVRQELYG